MRRFTAPREWQQVTGCSFEPFAGMPNGPISGSHRNATKPGRGSCLLRVVITGPDKIKWFFSLD